MGRSFPRPKRRLQELLEFRFLNAAVFRNQDFVREDEIFRDVNFDKQVPLSGDVLRKFLHIVLLDALSNRKAPLFVGARAVNHQLKRSLDAQQLAKVILNCFLISPIAFDSEVDIVGMLVSPPYKVEHEFGLLVDSIRSHNFSTFITEQTKRLFHGFGPLEVRALPSYLWPDPCD